MGLETFVINW